MKPESNTVKIKEIKSFRDEVINSASVDLEWIPYKGRYHHSETQIFAAAFCTNWGERIVLHISKYQTPEFDNPEKALIEDILFYFNQFPLTFGWYSTGIAIYEENSTQESNRSGGRDSDFFILHQRCILYNLKSPFEIGYNEKYITLRKNSKNKHIDLIKIFEKQAIKDNIFQGRYRTTSLGAVSYAILGLSKYESMNAGTMNIFEKPEEEQKKYVKRDAELTMMLAQYNNCLVLRLMRVFAHYAELDYYTVCHTNVSRWYANKYKKMIESGESTLRYTPDFKLKKMKIGGGHHTIPKRGLFANTNVYELDVKGMYPTIVINNNLSFDTLNCECCRTNLLAHLPKDTIQTINDSLLEQKIDRRVSSYWTCRKRKGAFPMILETVLMEREKYLKLLKDEKSKAVPNNFLIEEFHTLQIGAKLFANSGFGLFANEYFEYSNYKVAECITGEGRRIHKQMEVLASNSPFNFDIVFGFTDSIFFKIDKIDTSNPKESIRNFIDKCKEQFGITLEIKNVFTNSIFYGIKNRIVGLPENENDELIIKGLDGLAESNPRWVRKWVYKIIEQHVKQPSTIFTTIPRLLNEAIFDLVNNACDSENSIERELKYTQKLRKHPKDYNKSNRTGKLGKLLGKEKGEIVHWYEIIGIDSETDEKYSISVPKSENVNLNRYKDRLLDKIEKTLEIGGFDISKIRLELSKNIPVLGNA
jgi:DNA polymerase elongation subunit (family B)